MAQITVCVCVGSNNYNTVVDVFTDRFFVTALNNGDSSGFVLMLLLSHEYATTELQAYL
jgi:hypothetical protein